MYNFLIEHPLFTYLFVIVSIIALVMIMQIIGLNKIREYVYKLFVQAEHEFKYGDNKEKFEYVICFAREAIPSPFDLFITESLLRKVVQAWFDLSKDLLDDGKFNGTGKDDQYE